MKAEFHGREFRVADIGGGIGSTAKSLCDALPNAAVNVIDNSQLAKENFITGERHGLIFENYFKHMPIEKYDVLIFRRVLHHFVANTERETRALQVDALIRAKSCFLNEGGVVFIIENFYEPFIGRDLTGRIIFELTKLKGPSGVFRRLGANTAGEGVRFRSFGAWKEIFEKCGFSDIEEIIRKNWGMPVWQRVPFFCRKRFQALLVIRE